MKQSLLTLWLTGLLMLLCQSASAYDFESGGLYYDIKSSTDLTVEVTSRSSVRYSGSVTIPATVTYSGKTYSVTSIGYKAFYGCTGLTSITIGNSVTSIGVSAFEGCTGLTSITIGNSVTSIGACAFCNCTGLKSITIPDSVTSIGSGAFSDCTGLTSITIGNSATSIGSSAFSGCTNLQYNEYDNALYLGNTENPYVALIKAKSTDISSCEINANCHCIYGTAFRGCTGLTSITIPNSVTSIGYAAFNGCTGLTSIAIPNSVTSIGTSAFSGCESLTSITIPNSVTSISNYAFNGCTNLKKVYNNSSLSITKGSTNNGYVAYYAGVIYKEWITEGDYVLQTKDDKRYICDYLGIATTLTLPNVDGIAEYAFYNRNDIKSITIPNSVTSIGESSFNNCTDLQSVTIGSGVTEIGSNAFSSKPTKVFWLTNTPPTNYKNAAGMVNYVANSNYTSMSNVKVYPFLSSMFVVDGVKYVPVNPSERTCDAVDGTYLPQDSIITIGKTVSFKGIAMNVKSINQYLSYKNNNLKGFSTEADGIIEESAFYGCANLKEANIRNNGSIGYQAFYNCSKLSACILGDSISSIGEYAFYGCSALPSVQLGKNIKSVGNNAFSDCSELASVSLNDSVQMVGNYAFSGCSALPEIEIPQSVTSIGNYAFQNCTLLGDVMIADRKTVLSLGSNGSASLFADCPLDSVYIGGKISYQTSSSYGYSPFYRNTSLRTIVITDQETVIYDNEFYGCTGLKNVKIGDGVSKIGNYAFSGCSSLGYFGFGDGMQSIGKEAFSDCTALTEIYSTAEVPPTCGSQALEDINKWNCSLYVPKENIEAYKAADQWKDFFFINENADAPQYYTLTYVVDGVVYQTLSIKEGKVIIPLEAPVKEGYTFSGWSEIPATMPASDLTITGTFTLVNGLTEVEADAVQVNTYTLEGTKAQTPRRNGLYVRGGKIVLVK